MLVVVTGMHREALIVARGGEVVVSGGDSAGLADRIEAAAGRGARAVLSVGVGGGLLPDLPIGRAVIASDVVSGGVRWPADPRWRDALAARLTDATTAIIAGSDRIVGDPAAKAALHRETGAAVVDMESHVAARVAADRRLPFAALRVISDDATHRLPQAVYGAIGPQGKLRLGAVLRSLAAAPAQLPGLVRTARHDRRAMERLRRCVALLGAGFACPYLG